VSDDLDAARLELGPLTSLLTALLYQGEPVIVARVAPSNRDRVLGLLTAFRYVLVTKIPSSDAKSL